MRFEKANNSNTKKWYQLDFIPWHTGEGQWAVIASSGIPGDKGSDLTLHPLHTEFVGEYNAAFEVFDKKMKRLLAQGFKQIEVIDDNNQKV